MRRIESATAEVDIGGVQCNQAGFPITVFDRFGKVSGSLRADSIRPLIGIDV